MKILSTLAAAMLLAAAVAWAAAPDAAKPPAGDGNLVWSDEFDGKELDLAKWEYYSLGRRRDATNVKEAVTLDGQGHLVISTRKAGDQWQTGMIRTGEKFRRTGGYFECRMKLQTQPGHWSAFWLMPRHMGEKIGDTKTSGTEIDIFEYLTKFGDKIQHTLHWDGYGKDHKSQAHVAEAPGIREGWHTAGVDWTEAGYAFYVDGKETWRTDKAVSGAPEHIILSLEVGKWAGDIAEAKLPDSILFDYVRVYKTRPAPAPTGK